MFTKWGKLMASKKPEQLRRAARTYCQAGERIAALQQLDHLIGLDAAGTEDWLLVGRLLCEIGEFAQALGAFENCLQCEPQHTEARYELGRALYKLGDADRGAKLIEQVAVETGELEIWMGLATIAPAVPGYNHARVRKIREKFAELVRQAEAPRRTSAQQKPNATTLPAFKGELGTHRLRLGYVSAHWHDANYMKPVWPLINAHDRDKFEITLFDDSQPRAEAWEWLAGDLKTESIEQLDNRQAAERIAAARVDVLVDLSAYSQPQRLGMFVHRPAPIQMAWFNMYATSGFTEFDYIIGDQLVLQTSEQWHYTERCLQLPLSYLTFQTNHTAPPIAERSREGQARFTFGCLGTVYKLNPEVISTWCEILRQAESANLVLAGRELKSLCNQQYVLDQFVRGDVAKERITFLPPAAHYDFLKHYDQIDVALDTFPYNGGTTTMEALWQGVPVLTFNGDRWVSRTSRSLLGHSHLPQFAVESREAYVRMAVSLASDAERRDELQGIRQSMREKLTVSNVCDSRMLARGLEDLYIQATFAGC